jgi:pSer/pThr/pTyr-binding forkhead associated (FHA) protein
MTSVTIRVLEGMEQGRVFSRVQLPVTIGREDENSIQLNDDRISRFHAKLQDHSGRVILTDLDSTNGTRVNGHAVQMRILQPGDIISVGRCVLLLSEQHVSDLHTMPGPSEKSPQTTHFKGGSTVDDDDPVDDAVGDDEGFAVPFPGEEPDKLFPNGPPELPTGLNALQQVQLSDVLSHIHEQVGHVVKNAQEDLESTRGRTFQCDWNTWSKLVSLHSNLADYLYSINTPER